MNEKTEVFEVTVFKRKKAFGVTVSEGETWGDLFEFDGSVLVLGGVFLHLETSSRKRATSWAFSVGGSRILMILSATALAIPGLATKSLKLLDFKLRRPRPARFMVEGLGYFPSLSGEINLYHNGCPVLLKM